MYLINDIAPKKILFLVDQIDRNCKCDRLTDWFIDQKVLIPPLFKHSFNLEMTS